MALTPKKKSTSETLLLLVQVYQGPALQCESRFRLGSAVDVRLGKSTKSELSVPFAPFPNDILLFQITKWGAKVRLDPRFEGFVSDGQRFGSVRDFIAPRGALKELATVLEPLEVELPEGSRGALEITGYSVVFQVIRPKPIAKKPKVEGAPKAPFDLPYGQTPFEKAGFFLGVLASVLVTIPGVAWLNKDQPARFRDVSDLSPFIAAEIIHPHHFQILPWAYGFDFQPSSVVKQSVEWVDELRNKWQSEELGRVYETQVPALRGQSVPEDVIARQKVWQSDLDMNWQAVYKKRESAAPGAFVKGQNSYAPFRVVVAGGDRGSIAERVKARLERMDRTYRAAVSLIETEHDFMKDFFKQQSAEIPEIFDPPKEPGLFFRLAEKSFSDEKTNFQTAESFAALARKKQEHLSIDEDEEKESEQPLVWSGDSLVLASVLAMPPQSILAGSEDHLFKNANLSIGKIAPPPAPKPIPKINMSEVESFVRSRSPEVKACYDVALNRNPQLGGTIMWSWTIGLSGKIVKPKVDKTTIRDKLFVNCLEQKIKGWTFPKPVNGAITISFPFRFVVRENLDTLDRISR